MLVFRCNFPQPSEWHSEGWLGTGSPRAGIRDRRSSAGNLLIRRRIRRFFVALTNFKSAADLEFPASQVSGISGVLKKLAINWLSSAAAEEPRIEAFRTRSNGWFPNPRR